ncbi:MAG: P-loop NTPase [Lachnospiraceae bacterium]|nr:P-loop NTPase [Lachnospiraceae bacterium]
MQGTNDILSGHGKIQLDIDSVLRDVLKQWWVIILAALAAAFITGTYLKLCYQPVYTASTTFVAGKSGISSNAVADNLRSAESITANFSVITESSLLKKRVCEDLGLSSFNAQIYVEAIESSNLMTLTVRAETPRMAYLMCLSVMDCAQQLCADLAENISVRVIQEPVLPSYPSNPLAIRSDMRKAALLAAGVMIVIFVLLSYYKDTVKNESEMSRKVDARLLGTIYHEKIYKTLWFRILKKRNSLCIDNPVLSFGYIESVRMMATRIHQEMDRKGYKTVMLTSVSENEGKSTVAANLSLALTQEGYRVALLDCDFRKPSQYKIFDLKHKQFEITDFGDVLRNGKTFQLQAAGREKKLQVAFSRRPHNHMLDHKVVDCLNEILEELKKTADYIIIDSSPLGLVAEAETLANMADASILVVQQDLMEAKYINDMVDQLNRTRSDMLGCVYNNVRSGIVNRFASYGHYGYRYGYGYGHRYYGYGRYHYGSSEKKQKDNKKTDK